MVVPREENMARLYVQITSADSDRRRSKTTTVEEVQEAAKMILQPYHIEWDRVEWFSIHSVRQGIAEKYAVDQRIFIGGDACHTHSVCELF
jgi:2-polyprenyl-6-methoxyphenol hydroxylase-like FAD-dependent oxidoreductase